MRSKGTSITLLLVCSVLISCGSAQISDESIRKSDRYYQAAYIAWHEQGDNLAAIRHLTRAVEANPRNDNARYLLGTIRLGRGEVEEAEEHLLKAVEYRTGNPSKKVEALNSLGVLYINTERYEQAVTVLEEASKEVLNSAPWLAYGNLGLAYTKLAMYDKAETALKRALFDQPQFCLGLYRLGHVYYLTEKYEMANAKISQALSITEGGCDKLQEAHHLLGMTYLRQDAVEDAINSFETCSQIAPGTETGQDCASAREGL